MPFESVAVHVTVVVPSGKSAGALFITNGMGSAMSKTNGAPMLTGVPAASVASTFISAGAIIDGAVVSVTVTF